jgi:predicted metal-dependent peptidase
MSDNDPFATLEQAAASQASEEQAARALAAARCRLVLGKDAKSAFFATLALRLVAGADWSIDTLATDGRRLSYHPDFVTGLSADELVGVVAHEAMHNALTHHARRQHRDARRWNVACDLAVNPLLLDAGFVLPASRLVPGEGPYKDLLRGKSAEEYYGLLPNEPSGKEGEGNDEQSEQEQRGQDPGGCGGVCQPGDGSPAEARQSQADWEVAVVQAQQVAQQRGQLPGGLARLVEQILQPRVDWRDVLREFLSRHARNDYSWLPPSRRYIHQELYLPGLRSEELGEVVLAVDTSGSIGQRELARFAAEAEGILDSFDCKLTILYHDTEMQKVQRWQSSDGSLMLEPAGGSGTSHVCVFDWLECEGEQASCIVCLTDLYTEFPLYAPNVPVLWAVVGDNVTAPPFGLRIALGE